MRINSNSPELNLYRRLYQSSHSGSLQGLGEYVSPGLYGTTKVDMDSSTSTDMRSQAEKLKQELMAGLPADTAKIETPSVGDAMDTAQARVRDVDMAKEMLEFTKTNILNQAATAMLAQANTPPEAVLQLLR